MVPPRGHPLRKTGHPLPWHGHPGNNIPPPMIEFTRHDLVSPPEISKSLSDRWVRFNCFFQKLPRWLLMDWESTFCNSSVRELQNANLKLKSVIRKLPVTND